VARRLLEDWPAACRKFLKIMPTDFRRVMDQRKKVMAEIFEHADDWCRGDQAEGTIDFDRFAAPRDLDLVRDLLERYAGPKGLDRVGDVYVPHVDRLNNWDWQFTNFIKVIPSDSRRALLERKRAAEGQRADATDLPLEVTRG